MPRFFQSKISLILFRPMSQYIELQAQLAQLQQKISKLSAKYQRCQQALAEANAERKELRAINEKQKDDLKNFQNKIKMNKIVSSMATDTQQADAISRRIDEYVEEIDKCIAMLSEQ